MKKISIYLFISFLLTACLADDHPFVDYNTILPTDINDGWEISSPSAQNIDEPKLIEIFKDVHSNEGLWQMRSLLVFRNNKLVAESYLKDSKDLTEPRAVWSCTKQVLAVLTGIALDQGHLTSIDDPIFKYLSSEVDGHPEKADITIENLLTMKSGINFDEADDAAQILRELPDNTLQYILDLPMINSPGEKFFYNSGDPHLIAASIQNSVGKPTDEWADEVLFSKIGFTNYTWLRYNNYSYGGWGISATPRELGKIAALVLNAGEWNGEQIVDSLWIQDMIYPHVSNTSGVGDFGYLWWILSKEFGMTAYAMAGSGGQFAVIIPDKELIVVAMSEHDTDGDLELTSAAFFEIVKRIINISE